MSPPTYYVGRPNKVYTVSQESGPQTNGVNFAET